MTDVIQSNQSSNNVKVTPPLSLKMVELLFFAYRDFTKDADQLLEEFGFGRAHHRILHFVYHYPGLRVADLLDILQITKQSLSRVLRQLIAQGFILRKEGHQDRRERHLYTTDKGSKLARDLTKIQEARLKEALQAFQKPDQEIIETFLSEIMNRPTKKVIKKLLAQ